MQDFARESPRRLEAFPQADMKERAKIQAEVIKSLLFPVVDTPEWHGAFKTIAEDYARWWIHTEPEGRSVSSAIMFIMEAKTLRILANKGK